MMDKRELAVVFRERLLALLDKETQNTAAFLRDTAIDRSALSQFLDGTTTRLPRAESLRNIATARGISVDWLLGLENAPEGRQSLTPSYSVEQALQNDQSLLELWRNEADGHKLRYVPSSLPDMLNLHLQNHNTSLGEDIAQENEVRGESAEKALAGMTIGDMDIEIAMPIQTLHSLSEQSGLWRDVPRELCREQLLHMSRVCKEAYPALRVHIFDGRETYSAPFTVFGKIRVAIYIGDAYLTLTNREEIRVFVRRFDDLVRRAIVTADKTGDLLLDMAR